MLIIVEEIDPEELADEMVERTKNPESKMMVLADDGPAATTKESYHKGAIEASVKRMFER